MEFAFRREIRQASLRSIRSSSHARTERGFALIAALALAILYFALMELLLLDSSRALLEARQFRSRIVAATVAENAAELAALNMRIGLSKTARESDEQGDMVGKLTIGAGSPGFRIEGDAETTGVIRQKARVVVDGQMDTAGRINIDYTNHSQ